MSGLTAPSRKLENDRLILTAIESFTTPSPANTPILTFCIGWLTASTTKLQITDIIATILTAIPGGYNTFAMRFLLHK